MQAMRSGSPEMRGPIATVPWPRDRFGIESSADGLLSPRALLSVEAAPPLTLVAWVREGKARENWQ